MLHLGKNRHLDKLWLDDDNILHSSDPIDIEYMRIIYKEDGKTIEAVDPSGGPMMIVGQTVQNHKIAGFKYIPKKGIKFIFET